MAEQVAGGYNGKILRVNLSDNSTSIETIDELFCRKYFGGAGFIAYYLLKELKPKTDPLNPENKLIFALGPVTGVPLSGSGRHCVGAKSPLTNGFGKSEVGGFWGAELKQAGYDAIIFEGKAKKPTYLWIHDGEVNIKDASHIWGMNTKETQQTIRNELGDSLIRVASIGPAGENLVRYACIINDLHDAAGRGGMGAVMGSKNLKAVAVRGHKRPQVANPEHLRELRHWLVANIPNLHPIGNPKYGTGVRMDRGIASGNIPVRNFRYGEFPNIERITAETLKEKIGVRMGTCYACSLHCKKVVKVEQPYSVDPAYGGPEYETLAALGPNCGIDNLEAIAKGNELCNAYSLDTISTGDVIAFAMECFETGLLNAKDTDGIELVYDNTEAMLKVIELIARRQGIGNLLAEGTARAAQKIGGGAINYAMQVKGLEIPMHEPRIRAALGLGYIVNPHGADHCDNIHDTGYTTPGPQLDNVKPFGILEPLPAEELSPRKVSLFRYVHQHRIILDSLVICFFVPYDITQVVDIVSAVTGWKTSVAEFMRVAERIVTLARLFNIREGLTADDDKLPARFHQPKRDGVLSNRFYDPKELEKAKQYYYALMGWETKTGIPTPEKLDELDIS